jgi:hypothetical protein
LKAFCEAESGRQTAARIDEDAEDRRRAYLPPPPPDPTIVRRVAAQARELARELAENDRRQIADPRKPSEAERERANAWLMEAAIRAKTEPLPKLSPAALATLEKGKAA